MHSLGFEACNETLFKSTDYFAPFYHQMDVRGLGANDEIPIERSYAVVPLNGLTHLCYV